MYQSTTKDIIVKVNQEFVPERSDIEYNQYFYKYTVEIINNSKETIKVIKRKFKFNDGNGKKYEVNLSGVNGEFPEIKTNGKFEYNGFNPQNHETGNMRGSYLVKSDSEEFEIEFPLVFFRLKLRN